MAVYKYRARKGPKDLVDGTIEAQSEKEAIERLSERGYLPVLVKEEKYQEESTKVQISDKAFGKVKSRQITIFSRELASLLKSGVPILNALHIISDQSENPNLKDILNSVNNAVKEGATLSSALAKIPKVFSPLYIAMIRTGEGSGDLPEALQRISDYRAKQDEVLSRFRMAMAYPALMAVVGLCTLIFMFTFVMPRLMRIYIHMGQSLPLPTKILISISEGMRHGWPWIIIILVLIILVIRRESKTKAWRLSLSLFKLHIPILGKMILKAELSRFSRTLALLLRSGLPILNAIDISIPILENEIIKNQLKDSYKELEQGGSFGGYLKKSRYIPPFMSNLVIVGEESGSLDGVLTEIADLYERDTDEAMRIFSNLLEPIVILVMGLIVGFIVVAMLLPVFEINIM